MYLIKSTNQGFVPIEGAYKAPIIEQSTS
jgi:hypothetical protein